MYIEDSSTWQATNIASGSWTFMGLSPQCVNSTQHCHWEVHGHQGWNTAHICIYTVEATQDKVPLWTIHIKVLSEAHTYAHTHAHMHTHTRTHTHAHTHLLCLLDHCKCWSIKHSCGCVAGDDQVLGHLTGYFRHSLPSRKNPCIRQALMYDVIMG